MKKKKKKKDCIFHKLEHYHEGRWSTALEVISISYSVSSFFFLSFSFFLFHCLLSLSLRPTVILLFASFLGPFSLSLCFVGPSWFSLPPPSKCFLSPPLIQLLFLWLSLSPFPLNAFSPPSSPTTFFMALSLPLPAKCFLFSHYFLYGSLSPPSLFSNYFIYGSLSPPPFFSYSFLYGSLSPPLFSNSFLYGSLSPPSL